MAFRGNWDYALDERGRLPLPPRYRDMFRDGIVLSQGFPEACLGVYTRQGYDEFSEKVTSVPELHEKGRVLRRGLSWMSFDADLDKQSRVLIPAPLRLYAGLSDKALVIGAVERLEVWSPENFAREAERLREQLLPAMESYGQRE